MANSRSMTSSDADYEKRAQGTHSFPRLIQIAVAFSTIFFPLIVVATLLCLFVTLPFWTIHNPPTENANLPILSLDGSAFYTATVAKKVILTSSWASNITQWAATPFLLLFSFFVALELANRQHAVHRDVTTFFRGDKNVLFSSTVFRLWRARDTKRANGARLTGVGALLSLILMYVFERKLPTYPSYGLLPFISGSLYSLEVIILTYMSTMLTFLDKLLQGTITGSSQRIYGYLIETDLPGSFKINSTTIPLQKSTPDIHDDRFPPPCSIDS